jgi:protoheme IX farnesyltransferase
MVATVVGGTLAAGGANAINMYVDRDIDAIMDRTRSRPLVTGAVTPTAALIFALAIEAAAFGWLWVFVNLLSAVLALAACLFYVFVYTLWLKRTSTQNIVIGGAAGAVPVLIGWSAVTNSVAWPPIVLFAVIFFWTPPHFWALAVRYKDDYAAVDVPMLPAVASMRHTSERIVAYSVVVVALTLVFIPVGSMGWIYSVAAVLLGALFLWHALRVLRTGSEARAMGLFHYSITYLVLLFGAMAIDQLVASGT